MPKVYLAGPEVFLPNAREVGAAKQAICAAAGLQGFFPLDNEIGDLGGPEAAWRIYDGNVAMMRAADLLIANLTPFRGPSADAGTAFEVGFMRALGKPVFAYANVALSYPERVRGWLGGALVPHAAATEDHHGLAIEDFGLKDNLMLEGAALSGAFLVEEVPAERLYSDLAAFARCVALAAGG